MTTFAATRALLLRRRGLVFLEGAAGRPLPEDWLRALEMEWSALGHLPTARLRARLARLPASELATVTREVQRTLAAALGADVKHEPLFRSFPDGIPRDTLDLWWRRVLCHFLQAPDQPCLECRQVGTTHVLDPCHHVVCERCFSAGAPSACPVCGGKVDRGSPFFTPTPDRPLPSERVTFRLVDLGEELLVEARALFVSLCERRQPLSPADEDDLAALLADLGEEALAVVPATIPVKETVAAVFGGLFGVCDPQAVLPVARRHLKTATDVLRFVAALSGADPSLQAEVRYHPVSPTDTPGRWHPRKGAKPARRGAQVIALQVKRFAVARLSRPLRRTILELLEGFDPDALVEDMLRHRSLWVWVGEFLHPHEHAARYPAVARAFAVVRKKGPDGAAAPRFQTFAGRLEATVLRRDADALLGLLRTRPGELARRFDLALRLAGADAQGRVVAAFVSTIGALATPVLLTLRSLLPTRLRPAPVRLYWPKGGVALGPTTGDLRPSLPAGAVSQVVQAIEAELLTRFAAKPAFDTVVVDAALARIAAPFNERTAARSAVALPRGSRVPVPPSKTVRLFLHWCQPEAGTRTDIDLSVAFYDASWRHVGVCSFYSLTFLHRSLAVATSSGDLTSAPFPEGASEFVDVDRANALAAGARYAVMVVNNYSGLPFKQLERGFAGVMLRDDVHGAHFDPRTVKLRFDLQGENGVYLPLVLDLAEDTLHWLDVYSKGQFAMNTASTSARALERLCPAVMAYFERGTRTSMGQLALLHAAARGRRLIVREADRVVTFTRRPGETAIGLLERLRSGAGAEVSADLPELGSAGVFAALHDGDLQLPAGSAVYALFPGLASGTLAASDLIS